MKGINDLIDILSSFLTWDKRHLDCLVRIMVGLFHARTSNLKKIAQLSPAHTLSISSYRRFQRFFASVYFDYNIIAKCIYNLFQFSDKSYYLTLDRTQWQFGRKSINILFLCIEINQHAIPILWLLLRKKGNSNTKQRIALLNRFIMLFGKANITALLADREFIGKQWFEYLEQQEITYYIRVKHNLISTNKHGKEVKVSWLFDQVGPNEKLVLKGKRKLYGTKVYLTGSRSIHGGELMIVASNKADEEAIDIYLNRWPIETFFGCLKSRGFDFEQTHLTKMNRIKKLIVILALGYSWSIKVGLWRERVKAITLKKHGRKSISLFRYGLDWIQDTFMVAITGYKRRINQLCKIITRELSKLDTLCVSFK